MSAAESNNTLKLVKVTFMGSTLYELRHLNGQVVRVRARRYPLLEWAWRNSYYVEGIIRPIEDEFQVSVRFHSGRTVPLGRVIGEMGVRIAKRRWGKLDWGQEFVVEKIREDK